MTRGAERLLATAKTALQGDDRSVRAALDTLPAPIYVTDAEGRLTHFNRACVAFAGREPRIGEDRWCVTWKLFDLDGEPLPHDQCPMAVAVRERREVRGAQAIAERPDGTRLPFQPFPTPLFDADGRFAGAVNLLLDISDRERAHYLSEQASRCRRLASGIGDSVTIATLTAMAEEYEAHVGEIARPN